MAKREYSTSEVAGLLGVDKRTLYRWLYSKRLPEPRFAKAGTVALRVWSDQDIKRAAELKAQLRRGRPQKGEKAKLDSRLLSFHSQLEWYGRAMKLEGNERSALHVLLGGLSDRLRKVGLLW